MKDLNSKPPKKDMYNLKDDTYTFYEDLFSDFEFQL